MKKLLFCFLTLVSFSAQAQHCPYDGSAIIMVELKSTEKITQNHRVSLVLPDTIIDFWQNAPIFEHSDPKKDNQWQVRYYGKKNFPFLKSKKDVYLIVFGIFEKRYLQTQAEENLKIRVYKNPKSTDYQEFSVSNEDVHNLCKTNRDLWLGKLNSKILNLK